MMRKGFLLFSTFLVLIALAACGGDGGPGPSPASPSGTPATTSGATITGVVNGGAGGSGAGLSALDATTVTATVGGFTITATIDAEGNFVITGLPAGTVTLSFSGSNAKLTIAVSKSEKVKIIVTISGSTATVEEEERTVDGKIELEGRISGFAAEGVTAGFYVGETLVTLGTNAVVRHGDTPITDLTTLKAGDRVHVRGVAGTTPNSITAELVIVQNTNANVPANLKGAITAVNDATACPAREFTLSGWTVVTSDATSFSKGKYCSDLAVGAKVHVKGSVLNGKVQATSVQFDK